MPPKAKFTREEMIEKAVALIVAEGMDKLTARSLADALQTSVRPIFTAFRNMDEVKECAFNHALDMYHRSFDVPPEKITFVQIGLSYIRFAERQPQLFQLLFMKSQSEKIPFEEFMRKLDDSFECTIRLIAGETGLSEEKSCELYRYMWIFSHGIATMCATNQCRFTDEELYEMLENACAAMRWKLTNA